jgi:hypothetical protein
MARYKTSGRNVVTERSRTLKKAEGGGDRSMLAHERRRRTHVRY